jgi:hypothetical protein
MTMTETTETADECEPHTETPRGYLAWDEWAERMGQTHVQRQCAGCGLYAIWEPKAGGLAAADPDEDDPECG